jgi:sulfur-oxidizing protein SoxY
VNRREVLKNALGGAVAVTLQPIRAWASDAEVAQAIRNVFGEKTIRSGQVTLKLPKLAESGNAVPVTLAVRPKGALVPTRAVILATRNPRPVIATILFGPRAGAAGFSTNIRLNGTQDVIAVAELSDGSLWRAQVRVLVTVGACDALQVRY